MPAPSARPAKTGFDIAAYLPAARPARVYSACAPKLLVVADWGEPTARFHRVLEQALPELGVSPIVGLSDVMANGSNAQNYSPVVFFGQLNRRLEFRFPRNLPWEAYPVMARPAFRLKEEALEQIYLHVADQPSTHRRGERPPEYTGAHTPLSLDAALGEVDTVLLVTANQDGVLDEAAMLTRLAHLRDLVGPVRLPPRLVSLSKRGLRAHSWEDCERAAARRAGSERLSYGYRINFTALAGRALREAVKRCDGGANFNQIWDRVTAGDVGLLARPLALQVLCAAARGDGAALRVDGERVLWCGTGKHAATALDCVSQVGEIMNELAAFGLIHWRVPAAVVKRCREADGDWPPLARFLVPDEHGAVWAQLTERGRLFLDLLHPDCEDPDLPLRWRDADGLIGEEHIPAVDRCLSAMFRKMKRRVAGLEA